MTRGIFEENVHCSKVWPSSWGPDSGDSTTYEHGAAWPLWDEGRRDHLVLIGFVLVCPYEIVAGVLHRHWWRFDCEHIGGDLNGWTTVRDEGKDYPTNSPTLDASNDRCSFVGRIHEGNWTTDGS